MSCCEHSYDCVSYVGDSNLISSKLASANIRLNSDTLLAFEGELNYHDHVFPVPNKPLNRLANRATNVMPSSSNGSCDLQLNLTSRREFDGVSPISTTCTFPIPNSFPMRQKQPQVQQIQDNARTRRSNVVKEVERLKKNREERRQRQAELKEEKEALMNVDPGNPNWEFLGMIRYAFQKIVNLTFSTKLALRRSRLISLESPESPSPPP
ncbi:hypothetical protein QAD02_003096 [Eretmocerus hayati]|uniref:Uncharacterized protein n=1 Tax=Eretmocerus hayati TaxID=131215 RepID=A0ACC2NL55_9HYME|nr:hypothetical protein QAD02_003096 [Eretmocerus hayati]